MKQISKKPDLFYIKKCLRGNVDAYSYIVNRYQQKLYEYAWRMVGNREDATELALIALEKAYFALGSYSSKYAFSTWLYRVLINQTYDFLRENRQQFDFPYHQKQTTTPLEELERKEFWQQIDQGLETLPVKERSTFVLSVFHDFSVDKIATIMESPRGTVCWRLLQARKKLALYLDNYCSERM